MTDDNLSRRRYLKTFSGVAALATLAGCSWFDPGPRPGPGPTETPTGTSEGIDTETSKTEESPTGSDPNVINVVEAGASPNGDEPTVPVLEDAFEDGKTLFSPKVNLLTRGWRVKEFSDLTLRGEDATFRVEEGFDDNLFVLGNSDGASGLTVEGLEFDISAPNTGARPIHGIVEDGLSIKNIRVAGMQTSTRTAFGSTSPTRTGRVMSRGYSTTRPAGTCGIATCSNTKITT